MSETIPTQTPATVIAGDTIKWRLKTLVNGDHKDPADSWVLTYELRNTNQVQTITGTDNGDGYHLITITAATSAAFASGIFHYQAAITLGAIGGRSISRMSWGELLEARSKLQAEARSSAQAAALAKGQANSGIIRTRI